MWLKIILLCCFEEMESTLFVCINVNSIQRVSVQSNKQHFWDMLVSHNRILPNNYVRTYFEKRENKLIISLVVVG